MNENHPWAVRVRELNEIKDDTSKDPYERITALTELYHFFRGDVHGQACYVREIEDICRDQRC